LDGKLDLDKGMKVKTGLGDLSDLKKTYPVSAGAPAGKPFGAGFSSQPLEKRFAMLSATKTLHFPPAPN
jgi:hypothetical protein